MYTKTPPVQVNLIGGVSSHYVFGLSVLLQPFVDVSQNFVCIQTMYGASHFQRFVSSGGAADAVHTGLHQNLCNTSIVSEHFAHSSLLGDDHDVYLLSVSVVFIAQTAILTFVIEPIFIIPVN